MALLPWDTRPYYLDTVPLAHPPASRLRTQKKENDHPGGTFSVWVRTLPQNWVRVPKPSVYQKVSVYGSTRLASRQRSDDSFVSVAERDVSWMVAFRSAKVAQILRYFRGAKGDKGLSATKSNSFLLRKGTFVILRCAQNDGGLGAFPQQNLVRHCATSPSEAGEASG